MRKFKLIKEYPGSPKLGTILTHEELQYCNWNEYYQEVVEKDYEILEVKGSYGAISSYIEKLDSDLKDKTIFKIKRLSDGEIFTVGDKIFPNNKIYKFELKNDNLIIWHCDISFSTPIIEGPSNQPGNCSWIKGVSNVQKTKQPLFTTEDGVDIFEGDSFYIIDNWNIEEYKDYISINEYIHNLKFSTKEKAEEYILMNKPVLSVNEVIDCFSNWSTKLTKKDWSETLKKRAQKLNNKN